VEPKDCLVLSVYKEEQYLDSVRRDSNVNSKKLKNQKSKATLTKTKNSPGKSSCRTNDKGGRNKSYRQNRKSKSKQTFTSDEIVAWAEHHGGVSPDETQESHDMSESTYYRYVKNVDLAVKRVINIEDLRNITLMLFSLALKSVIHNLKEYHPGMTIGYLKGMGIFKEHLKGENMGGDFHQHNYFGDETINKFADKTIQARTKEVSDSGNRFKADRLSDSGNSLSDN